VTVELGRSRIGNLVGFAFRTPSVAVALPAGRYRITLTGADDHHRAGYQAEQTNERFVLELLDANGNVVLTTASTTDLGETQTSTTQDVGTYTVPAGVVAVRARHALVSPNGERTPGDINSIDAVSATFTDVS
jgi:hypothetical protein